MSKNRIEAFSDGVIVIIITIMVLELRIPELAENFTEEDVRDSLLSLLPKLGSYLLSFVVVGILWLNQHILFDSIPHTTTKLVWYNAFLLFVMSLIPLPTAFIARHPNLYQSAVFYGAVMFLNVFAFFLMRRYLEVDAKLVTKNRRLQISNLLSAALYLLSIPLSFLSAYISILIFILIPLWYFLPDKFHLK